MDSDDRQGGHSIEGGKLPAYSAEIEAELHDPSRLPHLHSGAEISRMFPTIPAAPAQCNLDDYDPNCVDELPQRGRDFTCVDELPQVSPAIFDDVATKQMPAKCSAARRGSEPQGRRVRDPIGNKCPPGSS